MAEKKKTSRAEKAVSDVKKISGAQNSQKSTGKKKSTRKGRSGGYHH